MVKGAGWYLEKKVAQMVGVSSGEAEGSSRNWDGIELCKL
jgi:hypothetical protein